MSVGKIIVLENLILNIDVFNSKSYQLDTDTWFDLSYSRNSGKLIGSDITYTLNPASFHNNTINNSKNYLSLDNDIVFNNGDEYSFDFFIMLNNDAEITKHCILGNGGVNKLLTIDYLGNNSWKLLYRDSNNNYINCGLIQNYNLFEHWCNIVFTVNSDRLAIFYINGIKVQETQLPNSSEISISRIMGGFEYNNKYQTFQGYLSNIKIYNSVLTFEDVMQNLNALGWRYIKNEENEI